MEEEEIKKNEEMKEFLKGSILFHFPLVTFAQIILVMTLFMEKCYNEGFLILFVRMVYMIYVYVVVIYCEKNKKHSGKNMLSSKSEVIFLMFMSISVFLNMMWGLEIIPMKPRIFKVIVMLSMFLTDTFTLGNIITLKKIQYRVYKTNKLKLKNFAFYWFN